MQSLNRAYELRDQEQKEAIESMQQDFEMQTRGLVELQSRNQEIQKEMNRYLDIFKRHNLSKLAAAKPGLIEKRVNNGTKEVFDGIEQDSRIIDSLDDGLQLQSNPKQVDILSKPIERTIAQPVMPREINLNEPYWFVVSELNVDEFLERVKKEEGRIVFVAMSIPDYELMAYNMQELKRYINELKEVVVYYRKVTTNEE